MVPGSPLFSKEGKGAGLLYQAPTAWSVIFLTVEVVIMLPPRQDRDR
jgi:hypothetical protein